MHDRVARRCLCARPGDGGIDCEILGKRACDERSGGRQRCAHCDRNVRWQPEGCRPDSAGGNRRSGGFEARASEGRGSGPRGIWPRRQHRAERHVSSACGGAQWRRRAERAVPDTEPLMRQRLAGDHLGRAIDHARRRRYRDRWRRRKHVAWAVHSPHRTLGSADGRFQGGRHDDRCSTRSF